MKKKIAIFPGSFDPITNGHKDIVLRAMSMFDKVIVAIGDNTSKKSFFSLQTRLKWLHATFDSYENIKVDTYSTLTTDYCKKVGAGYIIRGLRSTTDYQYETNIARINQTLCPEVETIFMLCSPKDIAVSSSCVREVLSFGGDVSQFVPEQVKIKIEDIQR